MKACHRRTRSTTRSGERSRSSTTRSAGRALRAARWLIPVTLLALTLGTDNANGLLISSTAPLTVRLDATVEVHAGAGDALEVWIPVPSTDESQDVDLSTLEVDLGGLPIPWELTTDEVGNHFVHLRNPAPATPLTVHYGVVVRRNSRGYVGTQPLEPVIESMTRSDNATIDYPYGGSVQGALASIEQAGSVEEIVGMVLDRLLGAVDGIDGGLRQAILLNEVLRRNGEYIKVGAYGLGSSTWFCLTGQGNCTDFHFTYLDIAERVALPARFRIGIPLSPDPNLPVPSSGDIPGYHCWVYLDGDLGFAIDPSWEARLEAPTGTYFGRPFNDRIKLTEGANLSLSPPIQGEPLPYLFEAYAESEGVPIERIYGAAEPSSGAGAYVRTTYAFTRIN